MSKISLEGNVSGSGTLTIAAPNTNSNYTLTLPESTGTMVVTGGAQTIEFAAGTVSAPSITTTGDTNTGIFFPAADTIAFTEGGTEAMRIDSSGQVGVGVTPSAWGPAGSKSLQVIRGSLWHDNSGFFSVSNNAYYDGSNWKYINSSYASQHAQVNGTHQWFTAAEGTAGNNITFAERMRIDNSGNVGIGTSSPSAFSKLNVYSTASTAARIMMTGTTNLTLLQTVNDSGNFYFGMDNSTGSIFGKGNYSRLVWADGAYPMLFATDGTERARITSGGEFFVGTTISLNNERLGILTTTNGILAKTTAAANTYEPFVAVRDGNVGKAITFWHSAAQQAGYINIDSTTTVSINNTSDYRIKKDIQPLVNSISRVKNLNPVSFTFTIDDYATEGFIAHEVAEVMPQAVHGIKDEVQIKKVEVSPGVYEDQEVPKYQAMDQSKLIPVLTSALKEAIQKIETLEANNAALEARITAIENGA